MPNDFLCKLISLIDLTSLNQSDGEASIIKLCQQAHTVLGDVAAVCVYPEFVSLCVQQLSNTTIQVATVANFPEGKNSFEITADEIKLAIQNGANEIDVVFPYQTYLAGKEAEALDFIMRCREVACDHVLKIILETGAFPDMQRVGQASREVIMAGADFIKTSTGKIAIGATLPATTAILMAIKEISPTVNRVVGLKVSGGIRTLDQASAYYGLVNQIMGPQWVSPRTFRIGASSLVNELLSARLL